MPFWSWFFVALGLSVVSYYLAPRPRQPDIDPRREFDAPTSEAGRAIPVVFGCANVTSPNVLHFTDKNSVRRRSHAEYRMTIHYGICQGADRIRRIRLNDKSIFNTDGSTFPATVDIDEENFHGGNEREGGIKGRILWKDGSLTQTMPEEIAAKYEDAADNLSAYRGLTHILFTEHPDADEDKPGFLWGRQPVIPRAEFMIEHYPGGWYDARRKIPFPDGIETEYQDPLTEKVTVLGQDMNPVHIIRDVMVNELYGCRIPVNLIDDTSFRTAANTLYAERFGLSLVWDTAQSGEELVQDILDQIEAVLYVSRDTGKFHLDVLRGGYIVDDLPVFDESNSKIVNLTRGLTNEGVNELSIRYTNPWTEKAETTTIQNLAAVARSGSTISDSREYGGIRNAKTAFQVAEREMAQLTEDLLTGDVALNRHGWDLRAGSVFKLTSTEHGLSEEIVRALGVDYGNPVDPSIRVRFIRDVFGVSLPDFESPGSGAVASSPQNFNVTIQDGAVLLDWDAPANDGGSPILLYEYQQNFGDWTSASGTTTQHTVSGLTNGDEYSFRVRAVTMVGPGRASPTVTINPADVTPVVPTAPQQLRALSIETDVWITWQAPSNDGGATVIRYEYELDDDGTWVAIVLDNPQIFEYRISNLTFEQEYEVRLRAVNRIGNGAETSAVHITLRDGTSEAYERPPKAQGLLGRGGILATLLFWDNPYGYYQNHARTLVYRGTTDVFSASSEIGSAFGISYLDDDLTAAGTYHYWIAWQSAAGVVGPESDSVEVTVAADPLTALRDLSTEILADPLAQDLLAPVDTPGAYQALAREITEQYTAFLADRVREQDTIRGDAITALTTRVDGLGAVDLTALQSDLDDLEAEVDALSTVDLTQLQADLDAAEADIDTVEADIDAAEADIDTLQTDILAKVNQAVVDALDTRVTDAEADILDNASDITNLTATVDDKADASAVTALDARVTQNETDITSNASDITQLETDVGGKADATALTALTTRVTDAENSISTNTTSITNLTSTVNGKADASALNALTTRVTTAETDIDTNTTAITNLTSTVNGKADATALTALDTRVTTAESDIDTNTTAITNLTSTVNGKADATALNALETRVTTAENSITTNTNSITSLTSTVNGKADATAVNALTTRVTTAEGNITTNTNAITSLQTALEGVAEVWPTADYLSLMRLTVGRGTDDRDPEDWNGVTIRFRTGSQTRSDMTWNATANRLVVRLRTGHTWQQAFSDLEADTETALYGLSFSLLGSVVGTDMVPVAGQVDVVLADGVNGVDGLASASSVQMLDARVTQNETNISTNTTAITNLTSTVNGKADASALTTLAARVTQNETDIDTNTTSITNLTSTVNGKADATALNALTTRVTTAETDIDTNTTAITNLTSTVNGKADATALNALTTRVTTAENDIDTNTTAITNLTSTVNGKADATALNALTTRVTTAESDIDTNTTAITNLTSTVNGKADATALNALTTRVTTAEGNITTNTNAITNLTSTVNGKADASALTALETRVTTAEGNITTNTNAITNLTTTVNGKADATALTALTARVTTAENDIDTNTSAITELRVGLNGMPDVYPFAEYLTILRVTVGRGTEDRDPTDWNGLPFRIRSSPDATSNIYHDVGTGRLAIRVRANDAWSQVFTDLNADVSTARFGLTYTLLGSLTETDTAPLITQTDYVLSDGTNATEGKADASAVTDLAARVTTNEGNISTNSTSITNLTSTVNGKADASALNALTTRVTTAENDIDTNTTAITNLTSTVDGKAEATALTALDTRVTTAENDIDTNTTAITNLTSTVNGKADASAVTTLAARVTTAENDIDTNTTSITNLTSTVDGKADATALTALDTRVTTAESDIDTNTTAITNLTSTVNGKADATALTALTTRVTTAEGNITTNTNAITNLTTTVNGKADASVVTALDARVTQNETDIDTNTTAITNLTSSVDGKADATALTALETRVTTAEGNISTNASSIISLSSGLANKAEASIVNTLQTKVTNIENLDGTTDVASLARWTVKSTVGSLTGGVGLVNDGGSVRFYVAADRFAVIPPGVTDLDDQVLPFVVTNDQVFLRDAMIGSATIGAAKVEDGFLTNLTAAKGTLAQARIGQGDIFNLTIGDRIASSNFQSGTTGWRIDKDGSAEFSAASIYGTLSAEHIDADVRNWTRLASPGGNVTAVALGSTVRNNYQTLFIIFKPFGFGSNMFTSTFRMQDIPTTDDFTLYVYHAIANRRGAASRIWLTTAGVLSLRTPVSNADAGHHFVEIWGLNAPTSGTPGTPGFFGPEIVLSETSISVTEGRSTSFSITLTDAPANDVTVTVSESSPDITVSPASWTISSTTWNTSHSFSVTGVQDSDMTNDTATITLTASGGSTDTATVSVTITDDDSPDPDPPVDPPANPDIVLSSTSITVTEGSSVTVNVRLSEQPDSNVTVTASETDADVSISPATRTFSTTNWNTNQSFTVSGISDSDTVNDTATITFTASGGSTDTATLSVTITDDDTSTPSPPADPDIQAVTTLTVTEGSTATFTVRLTEQPDSNVTVTATEADVDISVSPSSRTFTTTNWNSNQTFTVTGVQDSDTANDTATITLTASGGSTDTHTISVTITDDDTSTPDPDPPSGETTVISWSSALSLTSSFMFFDDNSPEIPSQYIEGGVTGEEIHYVAFYRPSVSTSTTTFIYLQNGNDFTADVESGMKLRISWNGQTWETDIDDVTEPYTVSARVPFADQIESAGEGTIVMFAILTS